MLKARWLNLDEDSHRTPLHWSQIALTTATLFLCVPFWERLGPSVSGPVSLLQYGGVFPLASILITALFFAGPALTAFAATRPLIEVIESSFGSMPTRGIRLCSACFLALWIAELCSSPLSQFDRLVPIWNVSESGLVAIAGALVVFLFLTGLQSVQTSAKLAFFGNKLGLAILVAALIRVREGLPTAFARFFDSPEPFSASVTWGRFSWLAFTVGPILFLASDLCHRLQARRQVIVTAGVGITLPLLGTMWLAGVIGGATFASCYYQPSLTPSVGMALTGRVSRIAMPSLLLIAGITMFGAGRFGVRMLVNSVSPSTIVRHWYWILSACLAGLITWCSLHPFDSRILVSLEASATCLIVVSAVITGDHVSRRRWVHHSSRIDWIACGALVAGLAVAVCVNYWTTGGPTGAWWHPELMPSYGTAFTTCIVGRGLQRRFGQTSSAIAAS